MTPGPYTGSSSSDWTNRPLKAHVSLAGPSAEAVSPHRTALVVPTGDSRPGVLSSSSGVYVVTRQQPGGLDADGESFSKPEHMFYYD